MTHPRGLSLTIAAAAAVVAGCIGFTGDPTGAPPTVSPSPAPTRSFPDFASFTPFPVATPTQLTCAPEPADWGATLDLATATGIVSIPLDPDVSVPMPSESIAPVDPADVVVEGTVLGGTLLTGDLALGLLDDDPSIAVTDLTARFIPLDASPAAPVVVAVDGASITLTLPDKSAVGRLILQVGWTSRCGAGAGGGATVLTVANSEVAAGCPSTTDEIEAAFQDINKLRITIGGIAEPLDVYMWNTRWTPGAGTSDFGTLFPNWDRDTVITAAPGENVAVREKVDDLQLISVRAGIYHRADVDAYFGGGAAEDLDPVTVVRRDVNPKGNINIPAPLEPGLYVFDVDASWLTSCFELQTTRSVSVRVVAPA
ncbi:MAG TPA: hypothetical protein VFI15_08140 [Candidatus Limnocylindrales bacterium]|nr:hypothetical protein [Candidatus Limnocylindrales bacterium]